MAAILSGYWVGWNVRNIDLGLGAALLPCLLGLLLLGLGPVKPLASPPGWRRRAAPILCGYALGLVLINAVGITVTGWGVWTFKALLVAFVVGGVVFPRRGEWLPAAGAVLFLFGSVVAMAYNGTNAWSGVDYWGGWLSTHFMLPFFGRSAGRSWCGTAGTAVTDRSSVSINQSFL